MADETTRSATVPSKAVKFVPFSSTVDSPFWVRYCHLKLETIRLKEDPIDIRASYGVHVVNPKASNRNNASTANRLRCQESSLLLQEEEEEANPQNNESAAGDSETTDDGGDGVTNDRVACPGVLLGYNTKESFQKVNKNELLKQVFCEQFFGAKEKELQAPSLVLLTFADLKQHKVLYWFGFPTLMARVPIQASLLGDHHESRTAWWMGLASGLYDHRIETDAMPAYFAVPHNTHNETETGGLKLMTPLTPNLPVGDNEELVFGFVDPTAIGGSDVDSSQVLMMGWPMRNLIAYLVLHMGLGGRNVKILSLRPGGCPCLRGRVTPGTTAGPTEVDGTRLAKDSILMSVRLPNPQDYNYGKNEESSKTSPTYKVVGWELNARHKPGPRWVNLRPLLDQNHLAIQAADLNLKLMKWRMIPDLNVDMLQNNCRVLLLGAGTLGCSVARTLLGWGIRDFTFVDYGNVSYSNPVRQVLFTLEDCHYDHGQGKPKAQAAADALKEIAADVKSEGIKLSIPMPGHASENDESLQETVKRLDQLIRETDVVFLLTDTRESRWLPTVMAGVHDKILINAALGLDSWLVMRHGGGTTPGEPPSDATNSGRLGCYFCNDVVAPENSTKNRTLDQQCTVTRPGLAPIASSMAVELLVSLLHHPKKQWAPGPKAAGTFSPTDTRGDEGEDTSPLGVVPHQIRGSIVTYTMMTPCVPAFFCCTGCSHPVLEAYRADKFSLVARACASMDGSYLENLAGLTAFRAKAAETLAEMDDLDWDDDEDEGEM
jgi:ubiquitin-like modifier-activating enzyme ATG7